jgi:ADP-ribose pyrophosphatase YjhB (NUDIX family)
MPYTPPLWPVSVKAVVLDAQQRVLLLENERGAWELPGGRLEIAGQDPGEPADDDPEGAVEREVLEETGWRVRAEALVDGGTWIHEPVPGRRVLVVTYGCVPLDTGRPPAVSHEHRRVGLFRPDELEALPLPDGYRRSIAAWAAASRRTEPRDASRTPGPVTAEDLADGVRLVVALLRQPAALAADWDRPAGTLEWSCWETAEHLADDLFAYAAQLGPQSPPAATHLPFAWRREAPGKPTSVIFTDRRGGPQDMALVLEACGALHVAMVRTAPPQARAHHGFGTTDPEGSAAMGLVELFAHAEDLAQGLGLDWSAPAGICARVLTRLFPDAPADTAPWPTLLWATGRGELPGHERRTRWRWYSAPRAEHEAARPASS